MTPNVARSLLRCAAESELAGADATTTGEGHEVSRGGPRRLGDRAEQVVQHWDRLGQPRAERFVLTATADGAHHYWLGTPDDSPVWTTGLAGPAGPIR